jgi:hypothetical protein
MNQLVKKLWNDQGGFILSTEAVILWTITVLGLIVGLVAVRDAAVTELIEVANTILTFDQSYTYSTLTLTGGSNTGGFEAVVNGSSAQDWAGTGTTSGTPTWYGVTSSQTTIATSASAPWVIAVAAP